MIFFTRSGQTTEAKALVPDKQIDTPGTTGPLSEPFRRFRMAKFLVAVKKPSWTLRCGIGIASVDTQTKYWKYKQKQHLAQTLTQKVSKASSRESTTVTDLLEPISGEIREAKG